MTIRSAHHLASLCQLGLQSPEVLASGRIFPTLTDALLTLSSSGFGHVECCEQKTLIKPHMAREELQPYNHHTPIHAPIYPAPSSSLREEAAHCARGGALSFVVEATLFTGLTGLVAPDLVTPRGWTVFGRNFCLQHPLDRKDISRPSPVCW